MAPVFARDPVRVVQLVSPWRAATVVAKGPTEAPNYALSITADGAPVLTHHRRARDKCWHCSFQSQSLCVDWSCADAEFDERMVLTGAATLPTQQWVHVAASFGGESMRLYVDGAPAGQRSTTSRGWSGWNLHEITTAALTTSDEALRLGAEDHDPVEQPFRGRLDDVQSFGRALRTDQLEHLYRLGVCRPD